MHQILPLALSSRQAPWDRAQKKPAWAKIPSFNGNVDPPKGTLVGL